MKSKTNNSGFTIIEVLIVLAIAGLIILIVFLAVPALQRNSRNTQRTNDASRVVAAMQECMNNNNGRADICFGMGGLLDYIDSELDGSGNTTFTSNQQLTTVDFSAPQLNAFQPMMDATTGYRCNSEGNGAEPGGGRNAVAILWLVETNGAPATRCMNMN